MRDLMFLWMRRNLTYAFKVIRLMDDCLIGGYIC
jgi:hypothetical protein